MTSVLDIYKLAAIQLRVSPPTSLSENNETRRVFDVLYPYVRDEMLEAGYWKFAMRTVSITEDTDTAAAFGYQYAHNKPDDWVKTYDLSASEFMNPPLEDWIEESNLFFANVTPLYVRYVSNDSGYGLDLTRWTALFTKAVAFQLAARAAPKAAGASMPAQKDLIGAAEMALKDAKNLEAMREPMRRPPEGRWAASRRGSRSWSGNGYQYG